VVAFALAGTVDIDLANDPLGTRADGRPVYLRDLWPFADEVAALLAPALRPELFLKEYAAALEGSEAWGLLEVPEGSLYRWDQDSTYVREPPFFAGFTAEPGEPGELVGAHILAVLGDSVTTDHISPAGSIAADSPAGRYLQEHGVQPVDFNTYGAGAATASADAQHLCQRAPAQPHGGVRKAVGYPPPQDTCCHLRPRPDTSKRECWWCSRQSTWQLRDWAARACALGVKAVIASANASTAATWWGWGSAAGTRAG
jgi:aconitate hydratase